MKVFVTGASGFIGSAVVSELIKSGHQVVGLARSEKSAEVIKDLGAEVLEGNLENIELLKWATQQCDGVIHIAFNHDFMKGGQSTFLDSANTDKNAILAMGEVLIGTAKPIVVTGGILGLPLINGKITEDSLHSENFPRTSETTALVLAAKGVNASVIRLSPSVHDKGDYGFIPFIISQARKKGVSAYPDNGTIHWNAVHRLDAAKAFRLAIERGAKGALYNVVGETSISLKNIAEIIGKKLNIPVTSVTGDDLIQHFEWLSHFISFHSPATNFQTKQQLGWEPTEIGLIEDIELNYFN